MEMAPTHNAKTTEDVLNVNLKDEKKRLLISTNKFMPKLSPIKKAYHIALKH